MNDEKRKVFQDLSILLKQAVLIFDARIKEVEGKTPALQMAQADLEADYIVRLFTVSSLKVYRENLSFIATNITQEDELYPFYLLPIVRTLFDVYSRFLHLIEKCDSKSRQALCCLAYQLMSYNCLNNQKVFDSLLLSNSNLISKEKFTFPSFNNFDYVWYRDSGLRFKSNHDLFKKEIINKYSNPPIKIFEGKDIVSLYGAVSEFCHGNPYYNYDGVFNERYWIATISFMITSYLIEIVDVQFLEKVLRRDYREWMKDVDTVSKRMLLLWAQKRTFLKPI